MTDRNEIIREYLELSRRTHEMEAYVEYGTGSMAACDAVREKALQFYRDNNITRQELTDYHDARRNVTKCDNVDDALAVLQKMFG